MDIKFNEKRNNLIITLIGKLNIEHCHAIDKALIEIYDDIHDTVRGKNVIINMKEVTYIDSSGIGALMSLLNKIRSVGGEFYLWNLPKKIKQILEITHIKGIFKIYHDNDIL